MTRLLLFMAVLTSPLAARATFIEGDYDASTVSSTELNDNRAAQLWSNTTPASGTLKDPSSYGLTVGGRFLFHTRFSLRFDNQVQSAAPTYINAAQTMTDQMVYRSLFAMLELPLYFGAWSISLGGGVGYAINFEYHQKLTGAENMDLTWQGHPIGARGRVSLAYRITPMLVLVGESYYEHVSSYVKAAKGYDTSASGQPVAQGDYLSDNQGQPVHIDLSGVHFGGGLRLTF